MIEIRHLRTLQALQEMQSFSKAANHLCLTQSAVSHQVKALESFYGMEVLQRQSGEIKFSALGSLLLDLAGQVLPLLEKTNRQIEKLALGDGGPLRVAIECHTCFDWLMPSMDVYRPLWPAVDLDIASGFHSDPVGLLLKSDAQLAIVSEVSDEPGIRFEPLFKYETVAVVSNDSPFAQREFLVPADFRGQTLLSYPVPDEMLDVLRLFLFPEGVVPKRRSSELTVALLQLVASGRGISALPSWAVSSYVQRGYVSTVRLGEQGLTSRLYAAVPESLGGARYVQAFIETMREVSLSQLEGVRSLDC